MVAARFEIVLRDQCGHKAILRDPNEVGKGVWATTARAAIAAIAWAQAALASSSTCEYTPPASGCAQGRFPITGHPQPLIARQRTT